MFILLNNNLTTLNPVTLYDNESNPVDNAIITLNDDPLNYNLLKIIYTDNDNIRNSVDVIPAQNRSVTLQIFHTSVDRTAVYIKLKVVTIDGNTIRTG